MFEIVASIVPPPPLFGHRHSRFLIIKKRRISRHFDPLTNGFGFGYDSLVCDWIIFYSFFSISINKLAILDYFGRNDASVSGRVFFLSLFYIRRVLSCKGTGFLSNSEWSQRRSKKCRFEILEGFKMWVVESIYSPSVVKLVSYSSHVNDLKKFR